MAKAKTVMSLKLILAVSLDGYVAKDAADDMSWTGPLDKLVFRLMTLTGGPLGVGKETFMLMPALPGREVVCLSSKAVQGATISKPVPLEPGGVRQKQVVHKVKTLVDFANSYPTAWLIGGPTVALAALKLGIVAEVVMCHITHVQLHRGIRDQVTPFIQAEGFSQIQQTVRLETATIHLHIWKKENR